MKGIRAASVAMAVMAAGCSVILSTAEPTQCTTTADCTANPVFRQRECKDGFCVLPAPPPGPQDTVDGGAPCSSTAQCTRMHGGEGWHCDGNGGQCVQWEANGCAFSGDRAAAINSSVGNPAWMDDHAILIGAIQPFTTRQASGLYAEVPYADRVRKAIDMAVEEIAVAQPAGIVPPGSPPRPIAVLHCNSSFVPETARKVFTHLTEVVGAKAVIVGADDDLAAIAQDARTRNTAIICSDCVGKFPEPPLAWRTIPQAAFQAPMAVWRLEVLEAQRKAGPNPPTALKVAVLTEPGLAPAEFVDQFKAKARFNAKSALQNGNDYRTENTEDPRLVDVEGAVLAVQELDDAAHRRLRVFADRRDEHRSRGVPGDLVGR